MIYKAEITGAKAIDAEGKEYPMMAPVYPKGGSMEKLGPTGEFPEGKIDKSDEGEIRFAIAADKSNGVVVIDFGKPVKWLGLPKEKALELGRVLISKAGLL